VKDAACKPIRSSEHECGKIRNPFINARTTSAIGLAFRPRMGLRGLRRARAAHLSLTAILAMHRRAGFLHQHAMSLEKYLTELRDLRATGAAVQETSYYSALAGLLNSLGARLKPAVRCVVHVASTGAGIPDVGLFAAEQFERRDARDPLPGQVPARGVVEAKPPTDDVEKVAKSEQVKKYLDRYGAVLVTNYRDFLTIERV
jgi:hypothetical protein